MKTKTGIYTIAVTLALTMLMSCNNGNNDSINQETIKSLQEQITVLTANSTLVEQNLIKFDTLDYTVFSNQEWIRLHESHGKNIKVNWPDGHFTMGIDTKKELTSQIQVMKGQMSKCMLGKSSRNSHD